MSLTQTALTAKTGDATPLLIPVMYGHDGATPPNYYPNVVLVDNTGTPISSANGLPVTVASLPLPTGAALDSSVQAVKTAIGTPFQAGGSIGNTSFGATQSGNWNITNITGTVTLPTGAATAAAQASILAATQANPVGAANFAVTPASVNSNASAVQIVAARTGAPGTGRVSVTLYNAGPEPVYYGPSGVTAATGLLLPVGGSVTIQTTAAIYAILPSGVVTANTVNALETY